MVLIETQETDVLPAADITDPKKLVIKCILRPMASFFFPYERSDCTQAANILCTENNTFSYRQRQQRVDMRALVATKPHRRHTPMLFPKHDLKKTKNEYDIQEAASNSHMQHLQT